MKCTITQGGRGQWAVYYTSSQSFNRLFNKCNNITEFLLVGSLSRVPKRSTTTRNLQKGFFCVSSLSSPLDI